MSKALITIHNASTGETITREMNEEELASIEAKRESQEAAEAEVEALSAAKQAAQEKLAALGLTPEEIAAITGGN